MEIFKFLSKFLSFKGVSPRNEGQNSIKWKILVLWGMMKGGKDYNLELGIICKVLSVGGNFKFFVEILEF